DALRALYAGQLDQANRTLRIAEMMAAVYGVLALGLLALLLYTQGFLRSRFHRRRSPRLIAATLVLALVAVATAFVASAADGSVRQAEDQTYNRLLHLWNARALLYDANGNESLSLIQRAQGSKAGAGAADQAFLTETHQLVDRPLDDSMLSDARRGD